jgi:thioesterase domain-containing protein
MSLDARQIEELFHTQIPITRAMAVRVAVCDEQQLVITAPLAPNHNHLGTAFGGSLNAIATLAGYGLVWLELRDPACHVVIRESSISFLAPVRSEIRAICRRPDEATLTAFHHDFARKGKARLRLEVTIEEAGAVAVKFTGTFVALR